MNKRAVFLTSHVNEERANLIIVRLLHLVEDSHEDITLYINSPGGSIYDGMRIYDTMQRIPCDVSTVCAGLAASVAQFILTGGERGKRFAVPRARILMHQPESHINTLSKRPHLQQLINLRHLMAGYNAIHTGQSVEQIEADHDRLFTASEAVKYGLIDDVITVVD